MDALGNAVCLLLTFGQQTDCPQLLDHLPHFPTNVVDDNAYDTKKVLATIARHGAEAVIPLKANRTQQRPHDEDLYADRNKVERFFGHLKEARGFATRYKKTATSFLAAAHLLVALDWLR